jgi:hypothetical protein
MTRRTAWKAVRGSVPGPKCLAPVLAPRYAPVDRSGGLTSS